MPPGPPPGIYPPPVMMPPPFYPPPPPRHSFARAIFMTLATSIFGLSIALNIYLLILTGFMGGGDGSRQSTLISGDAKQKVIVIPLTGLIDEQASKRFEKMIKGIESDASVKALVLEIDTPGGSVTASDQIYHRVVQFKTNKKVPVVVSMGGLATSGGYYIACAADKIVAQRTTITGNIGVLMPRYNLSKLGEKYGVEDTSLHSTGATFKTAGSLLKPETPEERAYWLGLIDDAFATFKGVVTTGRAGSLKGSIDTIANGKAYTANESLAMGLVDQIGYASDAYDLAGSLAKLANKHVVRYEPTPSLFEALGAESRFGGAGPGLTINGVNLNFDSNLLDELGTPRLMYLWRGQ